MLVTHSPCLVRYGQFGKWVNDMCIVPTEGVESFSHVEAHGIANPMGGRAAECAAGQLPQAIPDTGESSVGCKVEVSVHVDVCRCWGYRGTPSRVLRPLRQVKHSPLHGATTSRVHGGITVVCRLERDEVGRMTTVSSE